MSHPDRPWIQTYLDNHPTEQRPQHGEQPAPSSFRFTHRRAAALFLVTTLLLAAASIYLGTQLSQLHHDNADLQDRYNALSKERDDLATKNQTLATDGATLARASSLLANVVQQFDDLDTLSVTSDSNHIDLINWVKLNATFPTTAQLDEAYARFGALTSQQQDTIAQYTTIKTNFNQTLTELSAVLNIAPPAPTTGS